MREDWEIKKLESVCKFQNGFAFKSKTFKDSGTPVVRITNIQNEVVDLEKVVYVDRTDYDKDLTKYEIFKGDLLIAMSGATTGKIGIHNSDEVLLLNQRVGKFEPLEDLLNEYLFYFLSTKVEESLSISAGSAQPNLSTEQIKNFQIPIPPLPEQKQIVAILDKVFTAIDQAKANIEKNIENAKELFQSKLNDIFSQKGDGWEEKTLGQVCRLVGGGTPSKKVDEYYNGEIPWATVRDMNSDRLHSTDHQISEIGLKKSSSNIIPKSHVIIATRVGLGKVCILQQDTAINQDLKGIVPKPQFKILNEFIFWWYKSIAHKVIEAGTGATVQGVKLTFVNKLNFPLGEIEKQNRIVDILNQFSNNIEGLENFYATKLTNLENLKKSILQKAFAGELTKQLIIENV